MAVGVSALLGFLIPSLAELWLNLSAFEKVGIGASTFVIVLSLILHTGKPLLKRRVSIKDRLESLSVELRLTKAKKQGLEERLQRAEQERDELKAKDLQKETLQNKIKELGAESERLKAEIAWQQEQLNRFDGQRHRFGRFLIDAHSEGMELRGSRPSRAEALDWERHIRDLLERAVGRDIANDVLRDDPQFQSSEFDASSPQKFLELRLQRIENLRKIVANRGAILFRPNFDPYEWEDWKSPPANRESGR
jgi:chromosome segregation ATPase